MRCVASDQSDPEFSVMRGDRSGEGRTLPKGASQFLSTDAGGGSYLLLMLMLNAPRARA